MSDTITNTELVEQSSEGLDHSQMHSKERNLLMSALGDILYAKDPLLQTYIISMAVGLPAIQGKSQVDIANELEVNHSVISRGIKEFKLENGL